MTHTGLIAGAEFWARSTAMIKGMRETYPELRDVRYTLPIGTKISRRSVGHSTKWDWADFITTRIAYLVGKDVVARTHHGIIFEIPMSDEYNLIRVPVESLLETYPKVTAFYSGSRC